MADEKPYGPDNPAPDQTMFVGDYEMPQYVTPKDRQQIKAKVTPDAHLVTHRPND